jgi:serine/threonine protein phosphatase PrpC
VSYEPYQHSQPITKDDEFIIVASDGIWDVISFEEASSVINDYITSLPPISSRNEWDPEQVSKILVSRARKKWEYAAHIDDITCCVIKLTNDNGDPCFIPEKA